MSTYNTLLTCVLIIFVFLLLSMLSFKNILDNYLKRVNKNYIITPLIVISVILIVVSFLTPYFYTDTDIGNSIEFDAETGQTGDTIGGIMNPFIALAGAVLTFIAFYIQKIANDDIKNQFKIQQFESQFYEMIHLHKENVNELSINDFLEDSKTSDVKKEIRGRHVFFKLTEIFETLLGYTINAITYDLNKKEFNDAYLIFFWGIKYSPQVNNDFQNKLNGTGAYSNISFGKFKDYDGVSFLLGHYYRHLFMTVQFVTDSKVILDYEEKMKYLKILRAQLSNHEQIILFYNWLSGFGEEWENEKNHFFTQYKMIHNLWDAQLYKEPYIIKAINDLIKIYNSNYKNKEGFKPMFEFQGDDFDLNI